MAFLFKPDIFYARLYMYVYQRRMSTIGTSYSHGRESGVRMSIWVPCVSRSHTRRTTSSRLITTMISENYSSSRLQSRSVLSCKFLAAVAGEAVMSQKMCPCECLYE